MSMHKQIIGMLILSTMAISSAADLEGPGLGKSASEEMIMLRNLNVYPDGTGLPTGKGTVAEGQKIFAAQCAVCHGERGIGGSAEELSGGEQGLTGEYPDKTIGTYWPYATTLFDFIRRSMPLPAPGSLSDNDIYAVTAYLLHVNEVLPEDASIGKHNLAQVKMPNHDGFIWIYPGARNKDNQQ